MAGPGLVVSIYPQGQMKVDKRYVESDLVLTHRSTISNSFKSYPRIVPRTSLIHARRRTTANRGRALVRFLPRFVVVTTKHDHEVVAGAGDGLFLNAERSVSFYMHQMSRERER